MAPRQDWMLCTIPNTEGPAAEVLTAALIRLSDGNASYVVRHFAPPSLVRDLDITIRGSTNDGDTVYKQLKKKILEFEATGVELKWRVLGVRKQGMKYRGAFLLETPATYSPLTHTFRR